MTDIATIVGAYATKKASANRLYAEVKELEYELLGALKEEYPDEWALWERGRRSLVAEGVTVPVSRKYDTDKVLAEFGEEIEDVVVMVETVTRKVDGKKLQKLWSDAAIARRLEGCILPPEPKIKLG